MRAVSRSRVLGGLTSTRSPGRDVDGKGPSLRGGASGHGPAMLTLIAIIAVVGLFVVLGMYATSQPRRAPKPQTQPHTPGAPRPDEFPAPGQGSPHRPDGAAVPGSRDHRHEHGKP